jgi:hypothetical protein
MITKIEAHNYRCFPELAIDLDRYQVLAGPNGAGKTTLLDISVLIGDMIRRQRVVAAFLELGEAGRAARATTLTELLYKGVGDTVGFAFEARLPADVSGELASLSAGPAISDRRLPTHLRYELRLTVSPRTLSVSDEYLFLLNEEDSRVQDRVAERYEDLPSWLSWTEGGPRYPAWQPVMVREENSVVRYFPEVETRPTTESTARRPPRSRRPPAEIPPDIRPIQIPAEQLALGTVPPDRTIFPAAVWFMELLRDRVIFFDPDWEMLRRPAPPGMPRRLVSTGQNLPWLALDLQSSNEDEFASWIDHVRTALPQIRSIEAREREEDHRAYFSVEYEGGYRVTSSGLSDGTLRILAITIIPFLPEEALPRILVIEEPENGLHPQAIETALESLGMLYESQVWLSTHSPIVLAQTKLRDVLATQLGEDGTVTVVPGDKHPRLRNWRGTIDLGSLFAAGVLS